MLCSCGLRTYSESIQAHAAKVYRYVFLLLLFVLRTSRQGPSQCCRIVTT